ncbi:MAG: tetratricopeptide repeat protein [Chloroflexota bacterium]|nr:tetratricopeptide repeat protein [Chloroflexota bacterium]
MTRQTRISAFADRVIEAGWLLALVFAPYYFNLLTARHFEPDKATVVRALALIILAAWAIKAIERMTMLGERIQWRAWWRTPLVLPALVYAGVFLLATVTSVSPRISWWGSYNRLQGTYTNLSYIAIFAAIVGNLRTRDQLDRLITTVILTGFSVAVYGLIQHYGYDPLPWKGDVLTRISSTMGNSIFVAAYLIMVVPFALFRITTSITAIHQAQVRSSSRDWLWGTALLVLLLGQQILLIGLHKFGAGVRVTDLRYWWVFPGGLAVVVASFMLVSRRQTCTPSRVLAGLAGGLLLFWALVWMLVYMASSAAQQVDTNPLVADWLAWIALGVLGIGVFIAMRFFLPPRDEAETASFAILELLGYSVVLLALLLAIFFSQSRGPQIGLLVGLAVFVNVLLLRLASSAAAVGSPRTRLLRGLMAGAIGVELAAAAFLLAFNLSQAPFFERLREIPYVGRFGQFLQTGEGTGRVRMLIWAGDEQGKGALGLIASQPLRTIIGYGPETMFTVYNPFYPPELAHHESRGASPDRSHQAQLDELVTKGALGLLSYFFLFFSAIWLAWRLIKGSTNVAFQVLFIACLSAILAHLFEGLTGIPIVATLTMLWAIFGVLVAGGILDGQLLVGHTPSSEEAPVPAMAPPSPPRRGGKRGMRAGSQANPRKVGGASTGAPALRRAGSFRWTYAIMIVLALLGTWFWNLRVAYADMWYNLAASFQPRSIEEEIYRYSRVLNAITYAPTEDYYHLQLGNSLIQLAYGYKARNPQTQADLAPVRPGQSFDDLFTTGPSGATAEERALATYEQNSVEQLLEYARLVLERAQKLNPGNKDHSANLARLHALWHRLNNDPAKLEQALRWYAAAHEVAPNDVVILNERAVTLASLGPSRYGEVEAQLKQSLALDPSFADTYVKLGNLYRVKGQLAQAAEQYAQAIQRRPNVLENGRDSSLDQVIAGLKSDPAALQRLMDAYRAAAEKRPSDAEVQAAMGRVAAALGQHDTARAAFDRAISLAPENVRFRQQYTIALSETQQYDAALEQAQTGLQLAQAQQLTADAGSLTKLVETIQRRKADGGS